MSTDERRQALFRYCSEGDRVCPQPGRWVKFWELIGGQLGSNDILPPLILSGWMSSDREKRERFESHLIHAVENGMFEEAEQFLTSLPESDWHTCPSYLLHSSIGGGLIREQQERAEAVQRGRELYAELQALDNSGVTGPTNLVRLLRLFECLFGTALKRREMVQGLQRVVDDFNEIGCDPDFPFFEGEPEIIVRALADLKTNIEKMVVLHALLVARGKMEIDEFVDELLEGEA